MSFLFHQFALAFTTQYNAPSCSLLSLCKYWNHVTVHRTLRASSDLLYLLQPPPTAAAAAAAALLLLLHLLLRLLLHLPIHLVHSFRLIFFFHFSEHETRGELLVRLNPLPLPF